MKKILLIATGGTIASVQTEHGMIPMLDGEGLVERVPELSSICDISIMQLAQLDSTNIQPENWIAMARAIADCYKDYDGFVLTHGTDTMSYTAAAMHHMLVNLSKPIVITGSQLSLVEDDSDAPLNLITAFKAAANGTAGVYLAFNGRLMQGNATKKLYTENFDGFDSINVPDVARLENGELVWSCAPEAGGESGDLMLLDSLETRVVMIEITPGLTEDIFRLLADGGYRGIIIKAYGAGGIPGNESLNNLLPGIDYAIEKGVKVVAATQCTYDGVHMDRYEVGMTALKHGVVSAGMATTEDALISLMLELANK